MVLPSPNVTLLGKDNINKPKKEYNLSFIDIVLSGINLKIILETF